MSLATTIQNANRATEIAIILIKYGFDEVVAHTALRNLIPPHVSSKKQKKEKKKKQPFSTAERIRMAIEELGATYIKLAQVLSNRPDIMPDDLIKEFEKLQNQVPPMPFDTVKEIIETETGLKLATTFIDFEEKPIGSASIGQVHKAKLRSGTQVVVKVQRRNVQHTVQRDLSILKEVIRVSEGFFQKNGLLNPKDILSAFEKTMKKELDYTAEARNMVQFKKYYAEVPDFYVPRVYKQLSTKRILVQEYIEGCKITDVKTLRSWNINPQKMAEKGLDIYLKQIFEYGLFHADPHPGNIIIQESSRICLIDYGMVGKLSKQDKFNLAGVLFSMAQGDAVRMARSLKKLSLESQIDNIRLLEIDLESLIDDFTTLDISETDFSEFAARLQSIIFSYKMKVPPSIFIILRAITILEGIGKKLHPTLQLYDFLRPYGEKIFKEQYSVGNIAENIKSKGYLFYYYLTTLPVEVRDIITQISTGRLNIQVENTGYDKVLKKMDTIANRFMITFLICVLILGASLLFLADWSERLTTSAGIPYLSIVGYLMASGLSFLLFISIMRSGRF